VWRGERCVVGNGVSMAMTKGFVMEQTETETRDRDLEVVMSLFDVEESVEGWQRVSVSKQSRFIRQWAYLHL